MDIRSGIDVYEGSAGVDRKVEFIEDVEGLVDAVGIEPTTCRLRAECSAS